MNTEKYDQYDQVVEVKKYVNFAWCCCCVVFSFFDENTYLMREASIRQTNYYLCKKDDRVYLVDSDNHKDEISWVNLDKFVEIEEGDATYRKYRVLK